MSGQAETERKRALIEAQKLADVEAVALQRELKQKENEQKREAIANEMLTARARADADAALYRATQEAEANRVLLTPELLQLDRRRRRVALEDLSEKRTTEASARRSILCSKACGKATGRRARECQRSIHQSEAKSRAPP